MRYIRKEISEERVMKRFCCFFVLLIGVVVMSACDKSSTVVTQDLLHHRFVLIKLNTQDVPVDKQAFIEFGEHLTVNGKMCNRFFGQSTLEDGVIKSPGLAMTRMLCPDEQLNQLDFILSELFSHGAQLKMDKQGDKTFLQLSDKTNQLVFELKDLM